MWQCLHDDANTTTTWHPAGANAAALAPPDVRGLIFSGGMGSPTVNVEASVGADFPSSRSVKLATVMIVSARNTSAPRQPGLRIVPSISWITCPAHRRITGRGGPLAPGRR